VVVDSEIKQVRTFIVENYLFGNETGLEYDTSFTKSGIIDSTGMLELIQYLEKNHKITIHDQELIPENFDSLSNISKYLEKKLQCAE
jgi:acyl carrier protein